MFKNVLVPYDESEHARSALHLAVGMVGDDPEATVHVMTVVSTDIVPPALFSPAETAGVMPINYDAYDSMLSSIVEHAREEMHADVENDLGEDMAKLKCAIKIDAYLAPSPVDGISAYAADHSCDLVVMGRRGLGALRGMLGSVSYGVLRSIDVPVLTVK